MSDNAPVPTHPAPSLVVNWFIGIGFQGLGAFLLAPADGSRATHVIAIVLVTIGGWFLLVAAIATGVYVGMYHHQERHPAPPA